MGGAYFTQGISQAPESRVFPGRRRFPVWIEKGFDEADRYARLKDLALQTLRLDEQVDNLKAY